MDKQAWNAFVLKHGPRSGSFLQSWQWGEFQKQAGEKVDRQTWTHDKEIVGVAQWLERELPLFGQYKFCPKGPISIKKIDVADEAKDLFLRIEPSEKHLLTNAHKSIDLNPADTLITDLTKSEGELFAQMHSKTRYNIRLAKKHGVEVSFSNIQIDDVWQLFEQTASRGVFRLHPKTYYQKMVDTLSEEYCQAFFASASYQGEIVAANVMIDFGNTRTYLHGASSNTHRKVMAPYVLHWVLMQDAKEKGLTHYDWWGVAPVEAGKEHPWSGISRFKRGFGGEEVGSPGTYDVVLKPKMYWFYGIMRQVRRGFAR